MINGADYLTTIHHDGSPRYVQSAALGGIELGSTVTLRLRHGRNAPIEQVFLRTCPDGEQQFVEMQAEKPGPANCWWQARLHISMPMTSYRFLLVTGDGAWWYNGSGLHRHVPTDREDFRLLAGYEAPDWVRHSVFYQIFPDRFANGDPSNSVRDGEFRYHNLASIARRWGEPTSIWPESMVEFYGGDLLGVEKKLDYLQDLGITAIYLNPVFTAFSNHRYDVVDYDHVDPHLGGDTALESLRAATARRGMRLILDIVPNHCSVRHKWFRNAVEDPDSPSCEYFIFTGYPKEYATWLGVRSLPKLNYRSQSLRQVMYAGQDAIFRRWLRPPFAIDGWRVDVANMLARQGADQLGLEVGRGIRRAVKEENPQAYLVGENFFDGTEQLQGDVWDAVMNYSGFTMPVWYWLSGFRLQQHGAPAVIEAGARWSTQAFLDTLQAFRASVPWMIAGQQYNLLGSHDTDRIMSLVKGDPALSRAAAGLLLTYVGVPSIYYGDEIGLRGQGDHTRACMPWGNPGWDGELYSFYRTLIALRRESRALRTGGFQVLFVEQNTLAYMRDVEEEQVVVVVHRGPGPSQVLEIPVYRGAIPDGAEMKEALTGRRAVVSGGFLPLAPTQPGVEVWHTAGFIS